MLYKLMLKNSKNEILYKHEYMYMR